MSKQTIDHSFCPQIIARRRGNRVRHQCVTHLTFAPWLRTKPVASVTVLAQWKPKDAGEGARRWFLTRGEEKRVDAKSHVIRYASQESATKAAERLNAA